MLFQLISEVSKIKRADRAKLFLDRLKADMQGPFFLTDEKLLE